MSDKLGPDPRKFDHIRAGDLEIDKREQRPLREAAVRKIMRTFSWYQLEAVIVKIAPNGKYKVIEGQHRVRALQNLDPDALVPCMIIPQDAEVNSSELARNIAETRKGHTAYDRWKLRVAAGDKSEVLATAAMTERSVDLGPRGNRSTISAVTKVEKIMNASDSPEEGARNLGQVIDVIKAVWPDWRDAEAEARWDGSLIEAIWSVLVDYEGIVSRAAVEAILKERTLRQWINIGKADNRGPKQTPAQAIARAIVEDFDSMTKHKKAS